MYVYVDCRWKRQLELNKTVNKKRHRVVKICKLRQSLSFFAFTVKFEIVFIIEFIISYYSNMYLIFQYSFIKIHAGDN